MCRLIRRHASGKNVRGEEKGAGVIRAPFLIGTSMHPVIRSTAQEVEANYAAYLKMCADKGIVPDPTMKDRIDRILTLLNPPSVQSSAT